MGKRDLDSILREVQRKGIRDPDAIRQCMKTLGNRTLYSLMYGEKERCSAEKRYESWSYLEFVLLSYADLEELTEEGIDFCMKHITLKDFLCLANHLNDRPRRETEPYKIGAVRDDMGIAHKRELAFACLLRLLLRAKGRGDKDVNNFCTIHVNSLLKLVNEADHTDEKNSVADILYIVKENLALDRVSWMALDARGKHSEFSCLRELLADSMEEIAFAEDFSLPETIRRCREMGRIGA